MNLQIFTFANTKRYWSIVCKTEIEEIVKVSFCRFSHLQILNILNILCKAEMKEIVTVGFWRSSLLQIPSLSTLWKDETISNKERPWLISHWKPLNRILLHFTYAHKEKSSRLGSQNQHQRSTIFVKCIQKMTKKDTGGSAHLKMLQNIGLIKTYHCSIANTVDRPYLW